MCLFHRSQLKIINVNINNIIVKSTPQINVLGVTFDSKLQWTEQVANSIKKANKALLAISLIAKYFNSNEIKNLLTSNFFSVLYYNSEIWHLPKLAPYLKNLLLSISAKALKLCTQVTLRKFHTSNYMNSISAQPLNNSAFINILSCFTPYTILKPQKING